MMRRHPSCTYIHTEAIYVAGVDHEYDGISVGVITPPVGSNGGLSTQIPHLSDQIRGIRSDIMDQVVDDDDVTAHEPEI